MNTGTMFNGNHAYNIKQQIRYIYIQKKVLLIFILSKCLSRINLYSIEMIGLTNYWLDFHDRFQLKEMIF
jgi:hypothetical protein